MYILAADLILLLHAAIVMAMVFGSMGIVLGRFVHWQWIYHKQFRYAHLFCLLVIVVQAIGGSYCSLTYAEGYLRYYGGQELFTRSFMQRLFEHIVYVDIDLSIMVCFYMLFAMLLAVCWFKDSELIHKERAASC